MRVLDATGAVLGRLASRVAEAALDGEEVRVVNAELAVVTGNRGEVLERYRRKREAGTQRKGPHPPRTSDRLVKRTVRGMLPTEQAKGEDAHARVRCYLGVPEEFEDADIETLEDLEPSPRAERVEIRDISEHLGAKVR
jgi:large subunit ribosomal protein L13